VISTLEYPFEVRGELEFLRNGNGPEFIAEAVKAWLARRGTRALYIAPGSPWENAYGETFNSRPRDELLDREVFETLKESKVILEDRRLDDNHRRPHSSLGDRTPAEFAAAQIKPGVASPRAMSCRSPIPHDQNP
jgi:putative transposase